LYIVGKCKINVREYRRGIKNRQSRETDKIGYTRRRKNNKMCWTPLYGNKHKSRKYDMSPNSYNLVLLSVETGRNEVEFYGRRI